MSEKRVVRSEISSAGFEVHIDGPETKIFSLYAKNAMELEKVCKIAGRFKGIGLEVEEHV